MVVAHSSHRPGNTRNAPSASTIRLGILLSTAFILGAAVSSAFFLYQTHTLDPILSGSHLPHYHGNAAPLQEHIPRPGRGLSPPSGSGGAERKDVVQPESDERRTAASAPSSSILDGQRILVTIASYDFMQLPHLEEVLDGFIDLCYAGSKVDVVIYTTVVYPVALIDMFNDRLRCNNPSPTAGFTLTLMLKHSRVRLHLVDFHRELFYERIDQYDLFIYTEDDIRISPTTAAAYLHETRRVEGLVGAEHATDFNVGIVRYEYDFPENVVITDKTRHATENVTRVYWEHIGKPPFEKSMDKVDDPALAPYFITCRHPHQGMYLVTPALLRAWRDRGPNCQFDKVRDRPSSTRNPGQPTEGTQRVWMSSQMMYGGRHCAIKQLLPVDSFGQLTVLHLPNKNYRRVGKQGRLGGGDGAPKNEFSDGSEVFTPTHPDLLKGLELHVAIKRQFPGPRGADVGGGGRYVGIRVVDTDINLNRVSKDHRANAKKRLGEYAAYVSRGGYLIESDLDLDVDAYRIASSV